MSIRRQPLFRFNGQDAIGLAIGMKPNANLLEFGAALQEEMDEVLADLPVGVGVHLVADQPVIVEEAVVGLHPGADRRRSPSCSR